jgi:hypothetical protein
MPADLLLRYIPYHDVMVNPRGRRIRVCFRSLRQVKGPGGTAFHSRREPKLVVDGRPLTVAFSRHAVERVVERLTVKWPSYASHGDVFAFFDQCLDFELCQLHPQKLAFTFFDHCTPGFVSYSLAERVLGDDLRPGRKYSYRVGYCPAVVEGGVIKAKTMLCAGHASTPEYGRIMASKLPRAAKDRLIEQAKRMTAAYIRTDDGMELLKWFHDQGVAQVRAGWPRYADAHD